MGRPKLEIDPEVVRKLAMIHCTMIEIAAVVGCSVDTLEKRFADIIKDGKAQGKSSLRRLQWESAQKGNTSMLIWLGKQLLGQRDQVQTDSTIELKESSPKEKLDALNKMLSDKAW